MKLLTPEEFLVSELSPAQARLSRIVLRLHRCDPLDQIDSLFLAESLKNILLGHDPKKALGISGRQGSGRRKKSFREVEKTEIFPVIEVMTLMRMDGISWDAAIKKSADKYKINISTLKRHYTKHRESANATMYLTSEARKGIEKLIKFNKENDDFVGEYRRRRSSLRKDGKNSIGSMSAQGAQRRLRNEDVDGNAPKKLVSSIRKALKSKKQKLK